MKVREIKHPVLYAIGFFGLIIFVLIPYGAQLIEWILW